jgi:hypothetical protein
MRNDLNNGGRMSAEPQEIPLLILGWLASEPDILARFLNLSGIQPDMFRTLINDTGFLAGLIDFVMNHEPDLMAFCAASGKTPEEVTRAWHHYSGPGLDSGVY